MKTDILTFMKTLAILFFITSLSFSQNLVPNPSFEEYVLCPESPGEIYKALNWKQPTLGTPDYFNSCDISGDNIIDIPLNVMGFQNPNSGVAYSGFLVAYYFSGQEEYREYTQTKLISPLIAGTKYFVSFFVSLADSSNWATDDLGIYFSNDSITTDDWNNLDYAPQIYNTTSNFLTDKENWVRISSEFIAQGGENYITIGNFKNNSNTDTISVPGGGDLSNDDYYSYYYIDDVCVSSDSLTCLSIVELDELAVGLINIFPNPTNDNFMIKTDLNSISKATAFNSEGVLIFRHFFTNAISIDCNEWPKGVYFIHLSNDSYNKIEKLIIH